ncbi:uncharacterized protein LOC123410806 [Hordeum vulgare subsp. vulgare]|uniref:Predicted protein n=1 Tax=Hordeum vulgare subsp. vulgare TaxID=112509 RepID=F2CR42_HORVV|nr:uncharacterized protein LOC123410806 [Hordeum vulgare subsp. vulgare]KAI4974452.1 hypothetical protein ZWY2020_047732 [Hordeum vulgare]BAJ85313.1 predicted protein [Hordeum vulgare subsp. vulgare]BAJ85843.1 predicted protein [Hordeum vulgare subsp. vulgare]BAJ86011.1 predicted protein [Hordeum vulgare subsp. vulgare]
MSEQPLPQPRSSMREALQKEDKEKASSAAPPAKEKAAVAPPHVAAPPMAKNGGGGGKGGNGGQPPAPEETTREIQVVREAYRQPAAPAYVMPEEPPAMVELVGWYLYGFCSFFITHLLLPVLFPAIVTQVAFPSSDFNPEAKYTVKGASCSVHEMSMYQRLTRYTIAISSSHMSPLGWSALSWAIGILLVAPLLTQVAHHLDRGQYQSLILIAATSFGSFFCLLTGFFKTVWVFLFYILFIAASIIIAEAVHTRNLGLMIRGLAAHDSGKHLVLRRRAAASQLSLYCTAIGGIGAALMAAFMYHMLRRTDQLTGLWVVSIFSGLIWFIGICHGLFTNRPSSSSPTTAFEPNFFSKLRYSMTIGRYPQAIGSLVAVFLSSFATMCIFTSGTLYAIGGVCIKPVLVLALWILYFLFPLISLPLLHPIQIIIRADAVRMQLLGFIIALFVSGAGFYFKSHRWRAAHIIIIALVQSTANGILYSFGRILLLDASPPGKEGAFAIWYAYVRCMGAMIGFAVASAGPGRAGGSFAAAFLGSFLGIIVLIFGNVSNIGALKAAGHLKGMEDEKRIGEKGEGMSAVADSGESRGRV